MKNEFAPLGWTVREFMAMRARMAGIDADDVRMMRKVVEDDAEPEEDEDRTDAEPEEDEDRKKKAKADDDQDDIDEAEDRMNDAYILRGYSIRRRLDVGSSGLRRVALHEAGHCVVAIAQGRRIESVTVVPGEDYAGKVAEDEEPEMMKALLDLLSGGRATAGVEARARAHVVGYLAGTVAEWIMCPRESWLSDRHHVAGSDMKLAKIFARAITRSKEEAEALLTSARAEARKILLTNSRLVEAIADALVERGTLTGDEIDEIIGA
jgi:hypothetical protein